MPRFVAEFTVGACPRIRASTQYSLEDAGGGVTRIGIAQRYVPDALGTMFPSGATIEVEIDSPDIDSATETTFAAADLVVVLMNAAQPGWTTKPEPDVVYRHVGEAPWETYLFVDGWTPGPRTWDLPEDLFADLLVGVFNLPGDAMWRTTHAANGLRLALQDTDPAGRVPTTYASLEFLNPLLEPIYGARYTNDGQTKGVGGYVEERFGRDFEAKARRARNAVVHGKRPVTDVAADLIDADVPLLRCLRDAVISQLGATRTDWEPPANINSTLLRGRTRIRFVASLTPNSMGEVAPPGQRHPRHEVAWALTESHLDAEGKYHASALPTLTVHLAEGARLDIFGATVESGGGVDINIAPASVTARG